MTSHDRGLPNIWRGAQPWNPCRTQVVQPFDDAKFNFTKALQKEVLFQFEEADVPGQGSGFLPQAPVCASPNLVFINVSPIDYGHVLLVPHALGKLNQQVDPGTLRLALHFAHEAGNPYFRLAFNSLGAYGTVNHLHFQVRALPCFPALGHERRAAHVGQGWAVCRTMLNVRLRKSLATGEPQLRGEIRANQPGLMGLAPGAGVLHDGALCCGARPHHRAVLPPQAPQRARRHAD